MTLLMCRYGGCLGLVEKFVLKMSAILKTGEIAFQKHCAGRVKRVQKKKQPLPELLLKYELTTTEVL